jgi:hypothetical protein
MPLVIGGQCVLTNNGHTHAACDLSRLGSGKKDLPAAKAGRPTELVRWSQFQQVTLKVLRWEERAKHLVIKDGDSKVWSR